MFTTADIKARLALHNQTPEIIGRIEDIVRQCERAKAYIGARSKDNAAAANRLGIPQNLYELAIGEGLDNLVNLAKSDSFYFSCIIDEAKRQLRQEREQAGTTRRKRA